MPPSILERQPLGPLEEAARFRSLAEVEPIAALRRHLAVLAQQYEQIATGLEPRDKD